MTGSEAQSLWTLLGQTWGAKFLEQYGTTVNEAWGAFLENIDVHCAKAALRALILAGSPFPPTLPEFVAAARKAARDDAVRRHNVGTITELRQLPGRNADKARENLKRLREMVNG